MTDQALQIVDSRGRPIVAQKSFDCDNVEGSWRGPFTFIGELGGRYELTPWEDGWQRNLSPWLQRTCGAVYACKNVQAQAIATMPAYHQRKLENGGLETITTSPLSRILRNPNEYQTSSDFFLNLLFELLSYGNAYALVFRDGAERIESIHLVPSNSTQAYITPEGAIFYGVGTNPILGELQALIPARDVLHLRLHTPRHPLIGVSPIEFATMAIQINTAIGSNQAAFFSNMSRPSGVLTTDEKLTKEQMDALRKAWYEKSRGLAAGEVPVLSWGLKWNPMTISSQDSQLIEAYRMSIEDIARVYRVPLALIGDYTKATYNNVEQLINQWLSTGLGFLMTHIEQAFGRLFRLPPNEMMDFDTEALLRTDFEGRIKSLGNAITTGLMSPNEARRRERLPAVEFGEEPRVQQQVVPLSQVGKMPEAPPAPSAPESAPPAKSSEEDTQRHFLVEAQKNASAKAALLHSMGLAA
ncbi:MAG: phage portal protein [Caldilineaceae bacterium]